MVKAAAAVEGEGEGEGEGWLVERYSDWLIALRWVDCIALHCVALCCVIPHPTTPTSPYAHSTTQLLNPRPFLTLTPLL